MSSHWFPSADLGLELPYGRVDGRVLAFFSQLQPSVVAMEACSGAHFWGREIDKLGHEVLLIPPA